MPNCNKDGVSPIPLRQGLGRKFSCYSSCFAQCFPFMFSGISLGDHSALNYLNFFLIFSNSYSAPPIRWPLKLVCMAFLTCRYLTAALGQCYMWLNNLFVVDTCKSCSGDGLSPKWRELVDNYVLCCWYVVFHCRGSSFTLLLMLQCGDGTVKA